MTRIPVFVGLDYHQDSVQVCVEARDGTVLANRSCGNTYGEVVAVAERYGEVVSAAIESCTGAANLADELVNRAGWSVDLAHPGFVSRMKQNPDKTDFTDAHLLADLERVGYLPKVWLAPNDVRELRLVVRYRQQLVDKRRNIKLRVSALLRDQRVRAVGMSAWTKAWKAWVVTTDALSVQGRWIIAQHLDDLAGVVKKIAEVEAHLQAMTAEDRLVEVLQEEKGIGEVTAWTLRAEIGQFGRFRTGKQLSRYCGLSPRNASSGARQADAGLIRAGNPLLRATLMEAGHRLIRQDPRWVKFAENLLQRGKPKCVVVAAVANRWVRWLFHQMQPSKLAA
jgi:transposase